MIVAAMKDELEPVVRALGFTASGDHFTLCKGGVEWIAFQFGLGESGVERTLKPAIEQHRPDRLVVIGFAGGLDPGLKIGDLKCITSARATDPKQGGFAGIGGIPSAIDVVDVDALSVGDRPVLTASVPVTCPGMKVDLFEQTGCPLVDMESFNIASLCAELELPVKIWRAVSDGASDSIPSGLMACVRPNGTVNTFEAIRFLAVRPWLWSTAIRLRANARLASNSLVQAIRNELDASDR